MKNYKFQNLENLIKKIFTCISLLICHNVYGQFPRHVPTDSLLAWWPFNGNANDESGNGFNGTVTGATLTDDRNGKANAAYYFSGSGCNTRIDLSLNTSKITKALTISAWFYRSGNGCYGPRLLEFSPGYSSTFGYDGPGMAQWGWDNRNNFGGFGIVTKLAIGNTKGYERAFNSVNNNT